MRQLDEADLNTAWLDDWRHASNKSNMVWAIFHTISRGHAQSQYDACLLCITSRTSSQTYTDIPKRDDDQTPSMAVRTYVQFLLFAPTEPPRAQC